MADNGEAVSTTQTASTACPGRVTRLGAPASNVDLVLLLLALLVYMFGPGPHLDYNTVVLVVGGVALLPVAIEWLVPLSDRWLAAPGWLPSLTHADVLILLCSLVSGLLVLLPLVVGLAIWSAVSGAAWLRGRRAGADDWFHRAALFASFMAIMVANEASKVWLYSGGLGGPPTPLTHWGFHAVLDGSVEVSCVLLLCLLAWTGVRAGHGRTIALLLVASLPAAALAWWAAVVAILDQQDYGYLHTYAWLLAVFWVLTLFSAVRGHRAR